jgi:hypothetical protein
MSFPRSTPVAHSASSISHGFFQPVSDEKARNRDLDFLVKYRTDPDYIPELLAKLDASPALLIAAVKVGAGQDAAEQRNFFQLVVTDENAALIRQLLPYFDKIPGGRQIAVEMFQQAMLDGNYDVSFDEDYDGLLDVISSSHASDVERVLEKFQRRCLDRIEKKGRSEAVNILKSAFKAYQKYDEILTSEGRALFYTRVIQFLQLALPDHYSEAIGKGMDQALVTAMSPTLLRDPLLVVDSEFIFFNSDHPLVAYARFQQPVARGTYITVQFLTHNASGQGNALSREGQQGLREIVAGGALALDKHYKQSLAAMQQLYLELNSGAPTPHCVAGCLNLVAASSPRR